MPDSVHDVIRVGVHDIDVAIFTTARFGMTAIMSQEPNVFVCDTSEEGARRKFAAEAERALKGESC